MTERLDEQIALNFNQRAEMARHEQRFQKSIFEKQLFDLFDQGIKPEQLTLVDVAKFLGIDVPQSLLEDETDTDTARASLSSELTKEDKIELDKKHKKILEQNKLLKQKINSQLKRHYNQYDIITIASIVHGRWLETKKASKGPSVEAVPSPKKKILGRREAEVQATAWFKEFFTKNPKIKPAEFVKQVTEAVNSGQLLTVDTITRDHKTIRNFANYFHKQHQSGLL